MSASLVDKHRIAPNQVSAILAWLERLREEGLSLETLELYNSCLFDLLDFHRRAASRGHFEAHWATCNGQIVLSYFASLCKKGYDPLIRARAAAMVQSFFEFTVGREYLKENPIQSDTMDLINGRYVGPDIG